MTKFQTGDKVIIVGVEDGFDPFGVIGTVCCVTGPAMLAQHPNTKRDAVVYPVDMPPPTPLIGTEFIAFREENLKPYYDGDSQAVSEWSTELFQPKILERILEGEPSG